MIRDEAYWQRVREVAAKAPKPSAMALDMLRRNGFPRRQADDERQAS